MKRTIAALSVFLLLAACGESKNEDAAGTTAKPASQTLALSDGTNIKLNGKLLYSVDRPNDNGTSRLNKMTVDSGSKHAENYIYNQLSQLGYSRKVIDSSGEKFKVHYYKKNLPTIGSTYEELTTETGPVSTVAIYWNTN